MNKTTRLSLLALLLEAACQDPELADEATLPDEITQLDPTTPWNELEQSERDQFCSESEAYVDGVMGLDSFVHASCIRATAHVFDAPNMTPDQALDRCRTGVSLCKYEGLFLDMFCSFRPSPECTATVGEYATCLEDYWEYLEQWSTVSCEGLADGSQVVEEWTNPCEQELEATCG